MACLLNELHELGPLMPSWILINMSQFPQDSISLFKFHLFEFFKIHITYRAYRQCPTCDFTCDLSVSVIPSNLPLCTVPCSALCCRSLQSNKVHRTCSPFLY